LFRDVSESAPGDFFFFVRPPPSLVVVSELFRRGLEELSRSSRPA
jgi:hypothetical protein